MKTEKQITSEYVICEWDNVELRDVEDIRPWRFTIVGMQTIAETAVIVLGIYQLCEQWEKRLTV
jgi:hypothetical protein